VKLKNIREKHFSSMHEIFAFSATC